MNKVDIALLMFLSPSLCLLYIEIVDVHIITSTYSNMKLASYIIASAASELTAAQSARCDIIVLQFPRSLLIVLTLVIGGKHLYQVFDSWKHGYNCKQESIRMDIYTLGMYRWWVNHTMESYQTLSPLMSAKSISLSSYSHPSPVHM